MMERIERIATKLFRIGTKAVMYVDKNKTKFDGTRPFLRTTLAQILSPMTFELTEVITPVIITLTTYTVTI